jgi:hypothetical protein
MTVQRTITLRAAETLATFHREEAENVPPGAVRDHHEDMARRCLADVEDIKHQIGGAGLTVENQATALRQRDLTTALNIVERHPIMHGIGMAVDAVAAARVAMRGTSPTPSWLHGEERRRDTRRSPRRLGIGRASERLPGIRSRPVIAGSGPVMNDRLGRLFPQFRISVDIIGRCWLRNSCQRSIRICAPPWPYGTPTLPLRIAFTRTMGDRDVGRRA